jgi:allophanate hydrolase subunit 2
VAVKLNIGTAFLEGDTVTNFLETKFKYDPCAIDVLSPGSFTTIQDFPARATSGHGIPKAGPMDNVSSRSRFDLTEKFTAKLTSVVANILVDNHPGTESLEITLSGPELLFTAPAVFAVSGASVPVTIDGEDQPMWSRVTIQAGQKLKIGKVEHGGCRCYLAVKGGFPEM